LPDALSERSALQTLPFLPNPSSRCGYIGEKQRHLTRLVRRSRYLIAPPPYLKSTRASFAFVIKTDWSRSGKKQSTCFLTFCRGSGEVFSTDVLNEEGVFGRGCECVDGGVVRNE
jgi:hypothetical protein